MSQIVIKNIKLANSQERFLHNINLTLEEGTNVVFKPISHKNDLKSTQYLVKVLAGIIKPSAGSVDFNHANKNRITVGFKNFESIFRKGVSVKDFINTLIKTQKITGNNLDEVNELREILKINSFAHLTTSRLDNDQLNSLNLFSLLLIKPEYLLLDNLVLVGSDKMQIALLNYIKDYCKFYKITIILASGNNHCVNVLGDRVISIKEARVVSDTKLKVVSQQEHLAVDNKTKAFDLEEDILAALNSNERTSSFIDDKIVDSSIVEELHELTNENTEAELIKTITKALDVELDGDELEVEEIDSSITEESYNSMTDELLTVKYVEQNDFTDELKPKSNTSLNVKFTGSLDFEREEIKNKTRRLNEESKDILEEIKMDERRKNINQPSSSTRPLNFDQAPEKTGLMTESFLEDLRETYIIRKQLSEKIKSPDFSKLTPELQLKVFENHECADKLIKENDPEGKYDPYRVKTSPYTTNNMETSKIPTTSIKSKDTVTKKILEESIDNSWREDDNKTIYSSNRFETEEVSSHETLDSIIDSMNTKSMFDDDFDDEDDDDDDLITKKQNATKDFTYMDNEKTNKQKYSSWRDRFAKKEPNKNLAEQMYGSKYETTKQEDDGEEVITSKLETDEIDAFTKDLNDRFEPTSNLGNKIKRTTQETTSSFFDDDDIDGFETRHSTNVVKPTREFRTQGMDEEKTRRLKTMAIKQRSKKNLIEKLYDEAIEDAQIIDEYRSKKS